MACGAAELVVAQDNHAGSHIIAGVALMSQLIIGIVWAGCIVRAPATLLGALQMYAHA